MVKALYKGGIHMAEFGKYLKAVREKRGLGVNQLAALSGVSSSLISRVENGKRGAPKSSTIDELAKILKVSQVEMIFMAGYPSILQMDPEHEFTELAYKYMTEEDLEEIKKYKKATHQYADKAREVLKKEPENVIGKKIRQLRAKKEISHEDLAKELGFAPFVIYNIEVGDYRPDPEMINLLADYFEVTTDYLLGRSEKSDIINYKYVDDEEAETFYYNGQEIDLDKLTADQRTLIEWAISKESLSFKDKPQDLFDLLDRIRNIKPYIEEIEKKEKNSPS